MNLIDSHRRVDDDVTLGNCRMNRLLLRTNLYCVRGSSQQGLQHVSDRFYPVYEQAGTKISTKKFEVFISQDAQGSIFCKWAEIHCSRRRSSTLGWYLRVTEVGTKRLTHVWVKQGQFCLSFIAPWLWNGSFQRPQSFQSLNRFLFRSSPVVMNLREDWKNIVKRINDRDGIFAKSSRCDTSRQRSQVWNR